MDLCRISYGRREEMTFKINSVTCSISGFRYRLTRPVEGTVKVGSVKSAVKIKMAVHKDIVTSSDD